jgi:hypothetical protein
LTSFKDYPQEEYDHKEPWYEWTRKQLAKKDAWKREMEEQVRKLFKNRPKIEFHIVRKNTKEAEAMDKLVEWFEEAKKLILGEEKK